MKGLSMKPPRQFSLRGSAFCAVVLAFFWLAPWPPRTLAGEILVEGLDAVGMTVGDMDRAVAFYSDALSFRKVSDIELAGSEYDRLTGVFGSRTRLVRMRLGQQSIALTAYLAPPGGRPIPVDSGSNDLWFQHIAIVVSDMEKAYQHLRKFKVQHVSTSPQTIPEWNKPAAGIKAFYFRDPDGHNLELINFPSGKGDPGWQRAEGRLFLGVDHTAVAVGNTETSLGFYRDVLGLQVVGESLNHGITQEHLTNVFGARVRITALRSAAGPPGIELLQYLAPPGGRLMPADMRANDIAHWQTTVVVSRVETAAERLGAGGYAFVSAEVVSIPDEKLGFHKGFLIRDPDGHVIQVVE